MEGLTNVKEVNESITIGNGKSLQATKLGDLKCEVSQVDGRKFTVTLLNVKYVPDLYMNLFSLNKALQNGLQLSNEDISICLTKGLTTLTFDRIIKTANDFVTGVKLKVLQPEGILNGIINATISDVYEIKYLHKALGHCGLETLMNTAKMYDLETSGKLDVCNETKSDLKGKVKTLLTDMKIAGHKVTFLRCDDTGENKIMKDDPTIKSFSVFSGKFEFSGSRTPQRNGKVERKFQTFFGRILSYC